VDRPLTGSTAYGLGGSGLRNMPETVATPVIHRNR